MTAPERASRVIGKIAIASLAIEDALSDVVAMQGEATGDAAYWLPGLREALERVRLECVDAQHAARELRNAVPVTDTVQPRLL